MWEALNRISRQLLQLGVSILLARMLLPRDYGLVGMATIFIGFSRVVGELGFGGAIVQRKNITDEQLHNIFWLNLVLGFALWLFLSLLSPLIADFYEMPEVAPILVFSSLSLVLSAPAIVPRALIYKKMLFKYIFLLDWISIILSGAASIGAALLGMGAWSLVIGSLVSSVTVSVFAWRFCDWRIRRFVLKPHAIKDLFNFGGYYMGFQLSRFLVANLDYFIIGKLFTATDLGLYTLAFRLMAIPRIQIANIIRSVMYPTFVKMQDDDVRTRKGLFMTLLGASLLVAPTLTGLAMIAPDMIPAVYGQKWAEAAPLLRVLFIGGIASSVDLAASLMLARGKANWTFWMSIAKAVLFLPVLLLGAQLNNLNQLGVLVSVHAVLTTVLFQLWINRLIAFSPLRYFQSLIPATLACVIMSVGVYGARAGIVSQTKNVWVIISTQIAVGAVTYAAVVLLWPSDEIRQIKRWIRTRIPLLERVRFAMKGLR